MKKEYIKVYMCIKISTGMLCTHNTHIKQLQILFYATLTTFFPYKNNTNFNISFAVEKNIRKQCKTIKFSETATNRVASSGRKSFKKPYLCSRNVYIGQSLIFLKNNAELSKDFETCFSRCPRLLICLKSSE